jgi:hypothetical protein
MAFIAPCSLRRQLHGPVITRGASRDHACIDILAQHARRLCPHCRCCWAARCPPAELADLGPLRGVVHVLPVEESTGAHPRSREVVIASSPRLMPPHKFAIHHQQGDQILVGGRRSPKLISPAGNCAYALAGEPRRGSTEQEGRCRVLRRIGASIQFPQGDPARSNATLLFVRDLMDGRPIIGIDEKPLVGRPDLRNPFQSRVHFRGWSWRGMLLSPQIAGGKRPSRMWTFFFHRGRRETWTIHTKWHSAVGRSGGPIIDPARAESCRRKRAGIFARPPGTPLIDELEPLETCDVRSSITAFGGIVRPSTPPRHSPIRIGTGLRIALKSCAPAEASFQRTTLF